MLRFRVEMGAMCWRRRCFAVSGGARRKEAKAPLGLLMRRRRLVRRNGIGDEDIDVGVMTSRLRGSIGSIKI